MSHIAFTAQIVGFFTIAFTLLSFFFEGLLKIKVKGKPNEQNLDLSIRLTNKTGSAVKIKEVIVKGYFLTSSNEDEDNEAVGVLPTVKKGDFENLHYPMTKSKEVETKKTRFLKRTPIEIKYEILDKGKTKSIKKYVK